MSRALLQRACWALVLSLGILLLWILLSHPAFAQASGGSGSFSCSGGRPSGTLYDSGASCPASLTFNNIFSFLICNMEKLSSDLMGGMYCGMVQNLTPMVMGALSLSVLFFGTGFTIGVIPATAREFQKFMLKIGLIYAFATQSEYLIGIAYKGLVEGAREGIVAALSGLYPTNAAGGSVTGADVYEQLDHFLGKTITFATDYVGAKWDGTAGDNACKNAIFAVLGIMAVVFPPVFYISLLIIVRIAITFLRAVFGYVYAIVGIAFLMTLAPFFLSFYLFQQTRPYFDKWLGYLVSFALQMTIVFAFLTFVLSLDVKNLSASLVDIVMPVQETHETTALRFPWKYCTLCEFEVVDDNGAVVAEKDYSKVLGKGKMRCKTPKKAITALSAVAPEGGQAPNKMVQNALLKFAGSALLSLLILAYIVDAILRYAPSIAQTMAGAMGGNYAPQLGGGYSPRYIPTTDIPGMGNYDPQTGEYTGIFGSFERGFRSGFSDPKTSNNTISRTIGGVGKGLEYMVKGSPRSGDLDPALHERFFRFLTNPLGENKE